MSKATEEVKLKVKTKQKAGYVPTVPASVGGTNYYFSYTGGNDGGNGDIVWPVGHATATLEVKLASDDYTINTVTITPAPGSSASNFSWVKVNDQAAMITDTNVKAETINYTIMVNVPGGTVGCDPTIKNT